MAELLAVVGGVAAGMQLVQLAAEALLKIVKLVKELDEIPKKLATLLNDVDMSTSRLHHFCSVLLQPGSELAINLTSSQLDRLTKSTTTLRPAIDELNGILSPFVSNSSGQSSKRKSIRRFWNSVVALKKEKELCDRLERLDRLNLDIIRELGVVGLEMHASTTKLITMTNVSSDRAISDIQNKLDSLTTGFQSLATCVKGQQVIAYDLEAHKGSTWSIRGQTQSLNSKSPHQRTDEATGNVTALSSLTKYSIASGLRILSTGEPEDASLDFILFNIRTFYTIGNFDVSPLNLKTQFWKETSDGIYYMKISDHEKGFRLLQTSTAKASTVFTQAMAVILIEILSTLSPVNTTTCPSVRENLLMYLSILASEQLPRQHPIALVIRKLKDDNGCKDVSLRALLFITDRLRATLHPTHPLTLHAQKRLVALFRREGKLDEALRISYNCVESIRSILGPESLEARLAARNLEHIYIDQCDWPAALKICFEIVGQQKFGHETASYPDPIYHDECAVYTMEDIAKIYECNGNPDQSIAWLKQARLSGGMAWGSTIALAYIQDKLDVILRRHGRAEEAEVWRID